jgi:NADH-quinone oxidoreductase subunit A
VLFFVTTYTYSTRAASGGPGLLQRPAGAERHENGGPDTGLAGRCPCSTQVPIMEGLLKEYLPILIFLGIAVAIASAALLASFVLARQRPDSEKLSAYECGFEAFDDARSKFDVRFYLVAILFIIFDLEVAFLFPWAVTLGKIGVFGFWSMMVFLAVLTIGYVYEWKKGALEWE